MKYNRLHRPHSLARRHRWARLWLRWFVAMLNVLAAFGPPSREARAIGHTWLATIELHIVRIIWMRAAPHVEPVVWRKYGPHRGCPGLHRIITGARLRKLLRDKDPRVRAAKLSQDLTALIAAYLRRLRRGLTRLLAILARAQATAMLPACPSIAPALVPNTS